MHCRPGRWTNPVAAEAKVEPSPELAAKLKALPQDKLDFLNSDKTKGFAAQPELLYKRLENKTPTEIEAYVDGMMSVVEQNRFHPGKDEATIPLTTDHKQGKYK